MSVVTNIGQHVHKLARKTALLGVTGLLFLAAWTALQRSDVPTSYDQTVAAQGGASPTQSPDCDGTACLIWGIGPGNTLLKINTCTGVVVAAALVGPGVQTIAANPLGGGGGGPFLVYGTPGGALLCTAGFPPSPLAACGAVAAATNGLTLDGTILWAGGDVPALGSLFNPVTLIGSGGLGYNVNQGSDLVCDPSGQFGLMGEADVPVGAGALYSVSRGNGAQTNPRPAGGRATFSGLAYDGMNRLWGSDFNAGVLNLINPVTGIGVPTFAIPVGVLDLASDKCNSCNLDTTRDLGDAPDSTNHYGLAMLAYPAITALFPTVSDLGTGNPPGPFHRLNSNDSYLGHAVTFETDADQLPDADTITNIDPPTNTPDRDVADDGVQFPVTLPPCQLTQFNYTLRVISGTRNRYTNVWFDYNRNGQWGDTIQCVDDGQTFTVNEWAVQDQLTTLGTGANVVTTPQFRSLDPEDTVWMRITLAETVAPPGAADGRGYNDGYEIGETEDYLITPFGDSQYK